MTWFVHDALPVTRFPEAISHLVLRSLAGRGFSSPAAFVRRELAVNRN